MTPKAGLRPIETTPPDARFTRRRRRLRITLLVVAGVVVAATVLVLFDSIRVAQDMRAGRAMLSAVVDRASFDHELSGTADAAADRFARARRRARDSLWLRAAARVPLLGRPSRWLMRVADSGADLTAAAAASATRVEPLIDAAVDAPGRIRLLDVAAAELGSLRRRVAEVTLGDPGLPVPPFTGMKADLGRQLARLRIGLERGVRSIQGLRSFLVGPTRYLVLAANSAEMRAGGMVLQVGTFATKDGDFGTSGFGATSDVRPDAPVDVPHEIASLYGWLDPGAEWRNTGSSPNFPAVAPVYAAMSRASGIGRVDGVMQLDVRALRELLRVLGPVEVGGERYDAATVERLVLHDLYARYGPRQQRRRNDFSRLATEAFRALRSRRWRVEDLVTALRRSIAGRHLMLWSARPLEQSAWRSLGASGALDPDGLLVTVQNHGATKLDFFVHPEVRLRRETSDGRRERWRATVRITNPTPAGESPYVAGDGTDRPPGEYHGLVTVYLPSWAGDVALRGAPVRLVGPDGPMRVIGVLIDIPRGRDATITITFSGPADRRRLVILPSGRARPVRFQIGDRIIDDAIRRTVSI